MRSVAYRHAAYDTPWWVSPPRRSGRFHRARAAPTQYLSLHPLGPAAEVLRHTFVPDPSAADVATLRLRLWAAVVDVDDVLHVTFDSAADEGIAPDDLVDDDHERTQEWADGLRERGVPGIVVPSAALPGTENLVLFGPRVAQPYLRAAVTPVEVPTGHLADEARSPVEVLGLVRWPGQPHAALQRWRETGDPPTLVDPPVPTA